MKPDDVIQEDWDAADKLIVALEEEEHVDFSNDGRITEAYMDRQYAAIQAEIARAIMAAKVEEREACAKHIEEDMYTDQDIEDEPTDFRAAYNRALKRQANRVRSRT